MWPICGWRCTACGFFRLVLDDLQFVISDTGAQTRIVLVRRRPLGTGRELILETMLMLVRVSPRG